MLISDQHSAAILFIVNAILKDNGITHIHDTDLANLKEAFNRELENASGLNQHFQTISQKELTS